MKQFDTLEDLNEFIAKDIKKKGIRNKVANVHISKFCKPDLPELIEYFQVGLNDPYIKNKKVFVHYLRSWNKPSTSE